MSTNRKHGPWKIETTEEEKLVCGREEPWALQRGGIPDQGKSSKRKENRERVKGEKKKE